MNIVIVLIIAAGVFFVIYILSLKEDRKENEKYVPRGKIGEFCAGENDRRKCQRFDTELDLKYNLISSSKSGFSADTNIRNISKAGVSILVYEILPKNSMIEMEILLPSSKESIKIKGKVAWCEDLNGAEHLDKNGKRTFVAGIEFTDSEKKHQDTLEKYINTRLSQKK